MHCYSTNHIEVAILERPNTTWPALNLLSIAGTSRLPRAIPSLVHSLTSLMVDVCSGWLLSQPFA